jgi:hypothetical protein
MCGEYLNTLYVLGFIIYKNHRDLIPETLQAHGVGCSTILHK